jgi:hypothetical protein
MFPTLVGGVLVLAVAACGPTAAPTMAPEPVETTIALPTEATATELPTAASSAAAAPNAAPAVQIVPLQEGRTFMVGQEVGVEVLAADSDGISSAGLVVNGEVVSTTQGTTGTSFQGTLLWTPTAPGSYIVGVVVYDTANTLADIKVRTVEVLPAGTALPPGAPTLPPATPMPNTATSSSDTNAPAVSITPMQTEVTAGSDVDVAVNAVDSVGVVGLQLFVDGTVQDEWTYDPSSGPAMTSVFETLTWRNSTEGQHEVYVTATDAGGNVGQSVTDKVTVTAQ